MDSNTTINETEMNVQVKARPQQKDEGTPSKLSRLSTIQLLNFCLGFFGLQFAWQMRIILSGPVTENLGVPRLFSGLYGLPDRLPEWWFSL